MSRQLDAIFLALKLQLQNRTCKPAAIFGAICRPDIAGVLNIPYLKLDAILARQKLHRVAATKIASVSGPQVSQPGSFVRVEKAGRQNTEATLGVGGRSE